MKNSIFLIFTALFLISCSSNNLEKIEPKESLVQKANNGDLKAMISLENDYNFINSKEGVFYFEKWYKFINKNSDKNDLIALHKIYDNHKVSISDGKVKSEQILDIVRNRKDFDGFYYRLEKILDKRDRDTLEAISNDEYKKLNNEQLVKVANLFEKKKLFPKTFNIDNYMIENNYRLPYLYYFSEMRSGKKTFKEEVINMQYSFNDIKNFQKSINYFIQNKDYKNATRFLEKLKKLDEKNPEIYKLYAKLERKKDYKSEKIVDYYKKAAILGDYSAMYKLLIYYAKNKQVKEFLEFEKQNKNLIVLHRTLGEFYYKNSEEALSVEYYKKAAQLGDTHSIVYLASYTNINRFAPFLFNVKQKYQDYILNSNDWLLIEKALDKTATYYNQKNFKEFNEKLFDKMLKSGKFVQLKKYAIRLRDRKKGLFYLKEIVKTGDVESNIILARYYLNKRDENGEYKKALKILEDLAHRGDTTSIRMLADIYYKSNPKFEKYQNYKKALKYFEELSNKGDERITKKLVSIYMKNKDIKDYKKAAFYLKRLTTMRDNAKDYEKLGGFYTLKEYQDFEKAKMYFNKAIDKGYKQAYFSLGMLYYKDKNYNNNIEKLDYKKAFEYFKKAEKYDSNSWYVLGMFYKNGYATKQDLEKAKYYFKMAVSFGYKYAEEELNKLENM